MSFSIGNILFQLVIMLLLMIFVTKIATKPVVSIMDKRNKYINSQIDGAERSRQEAETYLKEQKEELEKVRAQSLEVLDQAKNQAQSEAKSVLDAAKERSELMVKEAQEEINREKEQAIASIRDEVADLSVMLASKILEKEINAKDYTKEIDQLMKQVAIQR
ncbi:F-type H+-transporting ATPase subunit b [Sporolactobacillus spathodeae]|uniref:ATP synthase subunit b n=1 Tax=Sporolactobacillus spathodeae TaxID=1465502 RepID=A0ABS2QAY5_9BACL|nr:F0F1 ATP synthase subunit B [Sporolactobacillus spathodeae]MBM7658969.1 F-type H+-transporting ATPase subunit b [Sporolactobacillus spathodeae]